ncbi:hypothetical protein Lfu02_62740 [Longispora fulva]|nr:hypothetical protein Lfu02_62740 [Longispora fulva]
MVAGIPAVIPGAGYRWCGTSGGAGFGGTTRTGVPTSGPNRVPETYRGTGNGHPGREFSGCPLDSSVRTSSG